jgi:hypothetical protein
MGRLEAMAVRTKNPQIFQPVIVMISVDVVQLDWHTTIQ